MIPFVILNYNSFEITKECINKIRNLENQNKIKIIVVDNNTLKRKEENELKKMCDKLIKNKENLGFARGNNIGISFALNEFKPDFVCVINSDCMIEQINFIDKIKEIYKKEKFDILGPKILSPVYLSWNPFPVYKDLDTVKEKIKYYEKLLKIYKNPLLNFGLNIYLNLKKANNNKDLNGKNTERQVALHGCCIIFSKKYLNKFKDAFYKETFLFHEEEFLYYRTMKNKLISIYSPEIYVTHLEGSATKATFSIKREKNIFKTKEILNSLYKLKEIMENDINI